MTHEQLEAFHALVKDVTAPPVLALPKEGLPYSVDTAASAGQVGGALLYAQTVVGGNRMPIGYWSRRLSTSERNYIVSEKECLAVVYMFSTCLHYLLGDKFDVFTDHRCLYKLMHIVDPLTRLMR